MIIKKTNFSFPKTTLKLKNRFVKNSHKLSQSFVHHEVSDSHWLIVILSCFGLKYLVV